MKFKQSIRGFMAPLMVVFILTVGGVFLVALVDFGRAYLTQTKLQAISDGASMTALQTYRNFDGCNNCSQQQFQNARVNAAVAAAQRVADANEVPYLNNARINLGGAGGEGLQFGNFSEGSGFTPLNAYDLSNAAQVNAVQAKAMLNELGNPKFNLFFGSLVGMTLDNIQGSAIASGDTIPLDMVFLMDVSGSMYGGGYKSARLAALQFMQYLLQRNQNRPQELLDRFGLVLFNDTYFSPRLHQSDSRRMTSDLIAASAAILMYTEEMLYRRVNNIGSPYVSTWFGMGWPGGQTYMPPGITTAYASGIQRDDVLDLCYGPDHNGHTPDSNCAMAGASTDPRVGTNIEMALLRAFWMLRSDEAVELNENRQRVMVVMTDGRPAQGFSLNFNERFGGPGQLIFGNAADYVGISKRHSPTSCNSCAFTQDRWDLIRDRTLRERDEKLTEATYGDQGMILYVLGIGPSEPVYRQFIRRLAGDWGRDESLGEDFYNPSRFEQLIEQMIVDLERGQKLVK